jgi:uncharacterized repeat protein (TIGR03803 family)
VRASQLNSEQIARRFDALGSRAAKVEAFARYANASPQGGEQYRKHLARAVLAPTFCPPPGRKIARCLTSKPRKATRPADPAAGLSRRYTSSHQQTLSDVPGIGRGFPEELKVMRTLRLLLCCLVVAGCSRGTVGSLPIAADPAGERSAAAHRLEASSGRQPLRNVATFRSLYSFKGPPDGWHPEGLIEVGGTLYGTTVEGGTGSTCQSSGCGTVFKITTSGTESVLYSFTNSPDGAYPYAGLTNVGGTLYGTTNFGGTATCSYGPGQCGTVFKITTSGTESILHSELSPFLRPPVIVGLVRLSGFQRIPSV